MKAHATILFLLTFSMLSGCGLRNPNPSEETRESLREPDLTAESPLQEMEDSSLSVEAPKLFPDALEGLSSYRLDVNLEWTRDVPLVYEGTSQGFLLSQLTTRQPEARQVYQLTSPGLEEWWVEAGGSIWECYDPESLNCFEFDAANYVLHPPLGEGIEATLMDAPQSAYTYAGEEIISGLTTLHFLIEYPPLAEVVHWDEQHLDTIQNARGELWIVNQAGLPFFVAQATVEWEGYMDGSDGEGIYEYSVSDVNSDIVVPLPQQ